MLSCMLHCANKKIDICNMRTDLYTSVYAVCLLNYLLQIMILFTFETACYDIFLQLFFLAESDNC